MRENENTKLKIEIQILKKNINKLFPQDPISIAFDKENSTYKKYYLKEQERLTAD